MGDEEDDEDDDDEKGKLEISNCHNYQNFSITLWYSKFLFLLIRLGHILSYSFVAVRFDLFMDS